MAAAKDSEVPRPSASLSVGEAGSAKHEEQSAAFQDHLTAYKNETRRLSNVLEKVERELANKRALLNWVLSSRSWRMTSWLRTAKFKLQEFRNSFRRTATFIGSIETPAAGIQVSDPIDVVGWAGSSAAPIVEVEAFVDSLPMGKLTYGQPRIEFTDHPFYAPINCGYWGRFSIDQTFSGRRRLVVRVKDRKGNGKDYGTWLLVHQGSAVPASPAWTLPNLQSAMEINARDDLAVARRLQASLARISLETFLLSNSRLRFPRSDNPEISIIIVLCNRAELTLQCFYSILQSDVSSYEVIIVDNASADETGQLLERTEGALIIKNEENLHYVLACNQATQRARGEYILLLNNDAQVQPQSISAALATLKSSADIGAVGGKVILPDGTLQEAGSIVWQDGSCMGYGRGASPLDPPFMFRRDVDYCSAVFLLTKRELFLAEGGFAKAYVPAYYEETDYCARLWEQGKRVVYEPDVVVTHHEFASSPSSEAAIHLQAKHQKVFVTRHNNWLPGQLPPAEANILTARTHSRNGVKRILLLDDQVPHLTLGSGFPRSNRMVRELVRMDHSLTLYPLAFSHEDWPSIYEDIPREVEVITGHGLPHLERFLSERAGCFDTVIISRPHNLANLRTIILEKPHLFSPATIIYDAEALFALRLIEERRVKGKRVSSDERQRILDEEIELATCCDRVVAVSEQESREFQRYGLKKVYTLGHAVTPSPTPKAFAERRDILFVGAIHEPNSPNADSVLWFSQKILPRIQKRLGERIKFIIAGVIHPEVEKQLNRESVRVKGPIKDLTELYNQSRIFVAPTRFSAGLPHKVHEAAAHGLPIVATPLLGSQLGWRDQADLLLAADEESFAEACATLYSDPELWRRLRENALSRVTSECSPETFSSQLQKLLE